MESSELLQAIRQIVKEEIEPIKKDMSGVKQDLSGVKQDLSGVKQDLSDTKQEVTKIKIFLENDIDKKLSALFDGRKLNTEKIDHISETVDDIDASLTAVDIVTRANIKEINKLKSKVG